MFVEWEAMVGIHDEEREELAVEGINIWQGGLPEVDGEMAGVYEEARFWHDMRLAGSLDILRLGATGDEVSIFGVSVYCS